MKRVLILTLRPLHNGPRIIREVEALRNEYDIATAGFTEPKNEEVRFYNIKKARYSIIDRLIRKIYKALFGGKYPRFNLPIISRYTSRLLREEKPDIIIVHDPEFLPQLCKQKRFLNFKLVYNAHEYHPLQFDSNPYWLKTTGEFYKWIYENYLKSVDLMINVCDSIAEKCKQEFGVSSIVIPNASIYYPNIKPVFNTGDEIRIIHHGGATRPRKIEYMIEAVEKLGPKYQLDLILVPGDKNYLKELTALSHGIENVNVIEPVQFNEIVGFLNKYDVGLFNLPPYTFNYKHALPNKLFEFIQARLCVVVSNSPEMKKIVDQYNVGLVSNGHSAEELVECLKKLDMDTVNSYKEKSDQAAIILNAEKYYEIYKASVRSLE